MKVDLRHKKVANYFTFAKAVLNQKATEVVERMAQQVMNTKDFKYLGELLALSSIIVKKVDLFNDHSSLRTQYNNGRL